MSTKITNTQIKDFLKDFDTRAHTEVLESGKEKEEIIAIAKAKMGIDLRDNFDLAGFKTIYTFENVANGNGGRVPKDLLLKALPTLIGKAVDINHNRQYVVGYYIDYRYVEKDGTAIAYGIFFKGNFGTEWAEAKRLLKENKLGSSHEIWCPKKHRKMLSDGTYEMQHVEFAGGALIYRNQDDPAKPGRKMQTAYQGCDVLEVAMKHMDNSDRDLLFASLGHKVKSYNQEELIVANDAQEFVKRTEQEIQEKVDSGFHKVDQVEAVKENLEIVGDVIENTQEPEVSDIPKVTCGNCQNSFETNEVGELDCPECKAIIDRTGNVLFPPQKFDFRFQDPEDGSINWRLLERTELMAKVKNQDSGRVYDLSFIKDQPNDELVQRLNFIYIGTASCPQCGHSQVISAPSKVDKLNLKCPSCQLTYHKNIAKSPKKTLLASYKEVTEAYKAEQEAKNKKELVVASLLKEVNKELEIASLELGTVDLDVASLSYNDSIDLELSSMGNNRVDLDVASVEYSTDNSKNVNIDKYKEFINKLWNKYRSLKREAVLDTANLKSANQLEVAKIQEEADKKIGFYKANAKLIVVRRDELGKFGETLSDQQILDDGIFAKAKVEKENVLLVANLQGQSDVIGVKTILAKDSSELRRLRNEINGKAFG